GTPPRTGGSPPHRSAGISPRTSITSGSLSSHSRGEAGSSSTAFPECKRLFQFEYRTGIKEDRMALKLIGNGLSPFVRKARIALAEKGLTYEHDPMVPFGVSAEYKRTHPLRETPLLA